MARLKHFILEIEPLDGEERTISVTDRHCEPCKVFAVIGLGKDGAVVVDNGYPSRAEATRAWPEAS